MVAGQNAADTRAAGGKTLGHGINDDHIVRRVGKFAQGLQRLTGIDKLAVGLVTDNIQLVLLGDVHHQTHLLRRQHTAGGIAGVGAHDGAGVLVDLGLDLFAVGIVIALLGCGGHRVDFGAAGVHHGIVVGIERLGNQNLVAVVQNALQHDLQRLAAAHRYQNLVLFKVYVQLIIIFLNGIDQHRHTG